MSNFIAIDLDAQGLYAAAAATRGGLKATHAVTWTAEDGEGPPALTPDTAKAIGERLREKLKAAGLPQAPVLVAVGRDRIILKELKYPPVPATEEPALVRFQAMKEMSESPDEVVLDYVPLAGPPTERRSMAVVLRKEQFAAIQTMCQAAGLKLAGVTPRPYAIAAGLTRAFAAGAAPAPEDKNEAVAALTLGPAGGEFTVVRRGDVTFTLAIPAPVIASETMLIAQIRRNLAVYAGAHPGHPVQSLYVAEAGGEWADRLRAALGVPVHEYDPLAGTPFPVPEHLRGRFAGALGLLAGRAANALPINFVTPRQPTVTRDPAKRRLAVLALGALLLLLAGGAAGMAFVKKGDERVKQLTKQRDELKEAIAKGTPDATRLKGIDGWTRREIVWLDELYDLADRMPEDDSVRITSLTATSLPAPKDGKDKGDGHARLDLKLATTSSTAATKLETDFVRDNGNVGKYYVGTSHIVTGLIPGGGKRNQGVTITTKINHRDPSDYTRFNRFPPLKKPAGGTAGGVPAKKPAEVAPPPTAKK